MALNKVAWIGRLTGPKGEIAYRIITEAAPKLPDLHFTIVGGPVSGRYKNAAGDNVTLTGFVEDIETVFESNDIVIGAGRVPVEAMQQGLPVIAVGENRYIGPINEETIALAKATNLGDCDQLREFDTSVLIDDLKQLTDDSVQIPLSQYQKYIEDYRLDYVYPQVMDVYKHAQVDAYLSRFKEVPDTEAAA